MNTAINAHDVDYVRLKATGCQYMGTAKHSCASLELVPGKLYCVEHYAVMYQKGSALRKRHKDVRKANAIRQLMSDFDAAVAELEAEGFDVYSPVGVEVEELT